MKLYWNTHNSILTKKSRPAVEVCITPLSPNLITLPSNWLNSMAASGHFITAQQVTRNTLGNPSSACSSWERPSWAISRITGTSISIHIPYLTPIMRNAKSTLSEKINKCPAPYPCMFSQTSFGLHANTQTTANATETCLGFMAPQSPWLIGFLEVIPCKLLHHPREAE